MPNEPIDLTAMPSALLARRLRSRRRAKSERQQVIGDVRHKNMKSLKHTLIGIGIVCCAFFLYYFIFTGTSAVKASPKSSTALDLDILGVRIPLTKQVQDTWNFVFSPLRYMVAQQKKEFTVSGYFRGIDATGERATIETAPQSLIAARFSKDTETKLRGFSEGDYVHVSIAYMPGETFGSYDYFIDSTDVSK